MPEISVIMPTFNTAADMLKEATESILAQTFTDFEFIIIDDCSTEPSSLAYLASITDPRVIVSRNEVNLGLTKSLNKALEMCRGKYIARMDADDVSLPDRLERQYDYMEKNPDTILCGSHVQPFGTRNYLHQCDTSDPDLYKITMLFWNPGPIHPTAFFRHSTLSKHHIRYDEDLIYAQDYGMWTRLYELGRIHCIPEILLRYRYHPAQISCAKRAEQVRCDHITQKRLLTRLMGEISDAEADYYIQALHSARITKESLACYKRLITANREKGVYDRKKFELFVGNLISEFVIYEHNISWKKPWRYVILLKYLPLPFLVEKTIRKIVGRKYEKLF